MPQRKVGSDSGRPAAASSSTVRAALTCARSAGRSRSMRERFSSQPAIVVRAASTTARAWMPGSSVSPCRAVAAASRT